MAVQTKNGVNFGSNKGRIAPNFRTQKENQSIGDWPPTESVNYKSSFEIEKMICNLVDLAKPNLFKITLNPPSNSEIGELLPAEAKKTMEFFVKEAIIPSLTIGKIDIKHAGSVIHVPGDVKFGEVSITFWNDVYFVYRLFFQQWMAQFAIHPETLTHSYIRDTLLGEVWIEQLDPNYEMVYKVILKDAWPTSIGEIRLAHDDEHTRETFQVTFAYTWLKTIQGDV